MRIFYRRLLNRIYALLAMVRFGNPQKKLHLLAVTGTDGKTTTVHLLASILKAQGFKVGLISTLGAEIDGRQVETGLHTSTPGPWQIYTLLDQMVQAGVSYVIIETTSHGLDQDRAFGLTYEAAAITNVSPEHLDYHKTIERYTQAKARLIKLSRQTIVSADNDITANLATIHPVWQFSLARTDVEVYASKINLKDQVSSFTIHLPTHDAQDKSNIAITMPLPGKHNVSNALTAAAMAWMLNIKPAIIKQGLEQSHQILGRWQVVQEKPFAVVIDFAHTPQAFAETLPQAKSMTKKGRLIHVFGSAAQRDKDKRHEMGMLSATHADHTIITMEDPRFESLDTIQSMIISGIEKAQVSSAYTWQRIDDRQQAIAQAISMAKAGDVVLITGKGHERSLAIKGQEIPWSDEKAALSCLGKSKTS